MKRIVLFTDALGSGGAQRQLVGLAVLLKEKSYDVMVLTYHHDDFYVPLLNSNGIPYVYSKKSENKRTRIINISKEIKRLKPDVLIAYQRSPAIIACFAKIFNPRVLLIVSERNTSQIFNNKERFSFNLYRVANYVVPNSYSQTEFILEHAQFLKNKLKTITNFVDTQSFYPGDCPMGGTVRLLTVARITRQKNILNYLKALDIVRKAGYSFKADWYGYADGGGIYAEKCYSMLKELDLGNYFQFHAPTSDVLKEYHTSSLFCLPSSYEGTPNVVCEAMSCGLPILCSDVCDNSKIVNEGSNGHLFNPEDPQHIAAAIIKFLDLDDNAKRKMGAASRELALSQFSKDKFAKKYIELIEN